MTTQQQHQKGQQPAKLSSASTLFAMKLRFIADVLVGNYSHPNVTHCFTTFHTPTQKGNEKGGTARNT